MEQFVFYNSVKRDSKRQFNGSSFFILTFCIFVIALNIDLYSQNLYPIIDKKNKWGFIDIGGNEVIKPTFDSVKVFHENMCAVKIGERWGYIDTSGNIKIKPVYSRAYSFSDQLALVALDSMYGYVNKEGFFAIKPNFMDAISFNEGVASIMNKKGVKQFIDKSGKVIIDSIISFECDYGSNIGAYIAYYHSGLVKINYDFYNKSGIVHDFNRSFQMDGYNFFNGLTTYKKNGLLGYVDTNGKKKIKAQYLKVSKFIDGKAWVIDKKNEENILLLINRKNNSEFSHLLNNTFIDTVVALINLGNGYCFLVYNENAQQECIAIDSSGNQTKIEGFLNSFFFFYEDKVPHQWNNIGPLFLVINGFEWKYINILGEEVWKSPPAP